jgi:hypothetical protein
MEPYKDKEWFKQSNGKSSAPKTYEKYGKGVINHAFIDCIKHKNNDRASVSGYTICNCTCSDSYLECQEKSIVQKSIEMLESYKIVPGGSLSNKKQQTNLDEIFT